MALNKGEMRQVSATPRNHRPTDEQSIAPTSMEGTGRNEVNAVTFSANHDTNYVAYAAQLASDRREMGDIAAVHKRRDPPPCPCPEDELVNAYELNRKRAADFRKITLMGYGDDLDRLYGPPLDDRDQKGYCRMMAKLMGLDVSAGNKTPTAQRLRNRLVTEQTWYDLQARMFLPPPVTNDRPITDVLAELDKKRLKSASRERAMWKQVSPVLLLRKKSYSQIF